MISRLDLETGAVTWTQSYSAGLAFLDNIVLEVLLSSGNEYVFVAGKFPNTQFLRFTARSGAGVTASESYSDPNNVNFLVLDLLIKTQNSVYALLQDSIYSQSSIISTLALDTKNIKYRKILDAPAAS